MQRDRRDTDGVACRLLNTTTPVARRGAVQLVLHGVSERRSGGLGEGVRVR